MTSRSDDVDVLELQKCCCCGKGMMHSGSIHFYEVTTHQCILDLESIRRLHGMELMTGSAQLAIAMAPSTRVAVRVPGVRKFVCSECAMTDVPFHHLIHEE